jgi:hypothetical protein
MKKKSSKFSVKYATRFTDASKPCSPDNNSPIQVEAHVSAC